MDNVKKLLMNLQHFAEGEQPDAGGTDQEESLIIPDDGTIDVETPQVEPEGEETEGEAEDGTDEADDTEGNEDDAKPEENVKFDEKQQAKINNIVNERLKRQEGKFIKDLGAYAGANFDGLAEIQESAKLWGFMKLNPDLSAKVQMVIDQYVAEGKYETPRTAEITTKEQELEVKEAILDMKSEDKQFAKNWESIKAWSEDNGYEIRDKASLKLMYLAWKGENLPLQLAKTQMKEQRKSQEKASQRKRASVEGSKPKPQPSPKDFKNMSDDDILSSLGLSLFTPD